MISKENFANRLASLRKAHKLTQQQLGKELNTTKQNINNWEKCVSLPSLDIASALADYFDVSLDYLVGRSDNPERL